MKFTIPLRWLLLFVLGGCLPLASVACTRASDAQTAGQTGDADPTQTTTSAARRQDGVWHHFGEENKSSPSRPALKGGWHYFGRAGNAPAPARAPARASAPAHAAAPVAKVATRSSRARRQYSVSTTGEMERQMFDLINRDRLDSGGGRSRPLRWNERLAEVARAHSLDMLRRGYFDHVAPDGKSVIDRLSASRIAWQSEGENIAIAQSAFEAETAFMNEPRFQKNHRWNILNAKYTDVGVGIVRGSNGEYYITQDFIESASGR